MVYRAKDNRNIALKSLLESNDDIAVQAKFVRFRFRMQKLLKKGSSNKENDHGDFSLIATALNITVVLNFYP